MKTQHTWQLIEWDGNPSLGLKCWRKKFGRGYVSVGAGDFLSIVYSYGAESEDSMCGSRYRKDGPISEQEAMALVDANNGHCL